MRKVGIVGYKITCADKVSSSREMMIFRTTKALLDEVGIHRRELDTVVDCSNDYYDGRTISNVFTVEPTGGFMKNESKVEDDGILVVLMGMIRVMTGIYDLVLVAAHSKATEFRPLLQRQAQFDQTGDRQCTDIINEVSVSALQAQSYMKQYNVSEDDLAEVAAKDIRAGASNPYAVRRDSDMTAEKVLASKILYSPIRELEMYAFADACCAFLLAEEKKAKKLAKKPIWILGVGNYQDTYYIGDRKLWKVEGIEMAASEAYKKAGIKPKNVQVAQVANNFAHQEPMICEALGFCGEGKGVEFALKNKWVNPSGGTLVANPYCAAGAISVALACMQLKGEAGKMQVDSPKIALAHGQEGICMQKNVIMVLGLK
jgi:acetyl-CoA C-acetyltransferase